MYTGYILGGSGENSFHKSCALFALSSCNNVTKWIWHFGKQRTIYVHLNLMNVSRKTRGFLAGYVIYKRGKDLQNLCYLLPKFVRQRGSFCCCVLQLSLKPSFLLILWKHVASSLLIRDYMGALGCKSL